MGSFEVQSGNGEIPLPLPFPLYALERYTVD